MEKWVLSIVGIVAISVLIDIILPEGDTAKYIKGVFAIMTICVIIAPLPGMISALRSGDIDFIESGDIVIDDAFIEEYNSDKNAQIEENITKILNYSSIKVEKVTIKDNNRDNKIDGVDIVLASSKDVEKARAIITKYIKIKEVNISAK